MRSSSPSAALVICDEHMLRGLFAAYLRSTAPDLSIVEAASLAVADLSAVPPGSVVLFVDASDDSDKLVETIRTAAEQLPEHSIAVVSNFRGAKLKQLKELRVSGYISTQTPSVTLVHTVRLLLAGCDFMSPLLISALAHGESAGGYADKLGRPRPLTQTEHAVLRRLQQGKPNKVIGAELKMEENTVKSHLRSLMRKFGAHNRVELVLATKDIRSELAREQSQVTVRDRETKQAVQ
ncbi:MAG: response regulator transcription factor [Alphaproteobacteria bacterium]|nr:response regulator transcription factor [Alphaproteobacteria bacterium]